MKKRQSNFEALRLLSMAMVVTLHYLGKGEILPYFSQPVDGLGWIAELIEAAAFVAVNVYVLLTGYFMCQSRFRLGRLLQIVLQVWFYSLIIPLILGLFGVLDLSGLTTYDWLMLIFPLNMEHYWFMTAYVQLVLLTPLLNRAIAVMNQKQLAAAAILVTLPQTFPKSILPATLTMDDNGYGVLWFLALYLIAAYLRKYGIRLLSSKGKAMAVYLAGVLGIWAGGFVMNRIYLSTGRFLEKLSLTYSYNHLFTLVASVAFFCLFADMKNSEGWLGRMIVRLAPFSLGVYLLHENILIRYQWLTWLNVTKPDSLLQLLTEWIVKVALVMAVGLCVDFLRSLLFRAGERALAHTPVPKLIRKVDEAVN